MPDHSKMNKDEQFLLKIVQPSLLGFMDGSISTLAPVFGFAVSGDAKTAFMAGTLVSVGAGISMGQAEAISDDGKLTGPSWCVSKRLIQRMSVDFPEPDGPQMTIRSPRFTSKSISFST